MSETNKAVICRFVSAMNTQTWDSLRILLVPHFVRHSTAGGVPEVRSAEELITYLKNEYITFPDAQEILLDLVAEGESEAPRSQFRGTELGSMGSYPLFGRVLSAILLPIAKKEGALLKRGHNGTTCMGFSNLAMTIYGNLRMEACSLLDKPIMRRCPRQPVFRPMPRPVRTIPPQPFWPRPHFECDRPNCQSVHSQAKRC